MSIQIFIFLTSNIGVLIVPYRVLGVCTDPEISGTGSGKVGGGGLLKPSRIRPHLMQKMAAVESQQQRRQQEQGMLPTHSRCDTGRVNGQPSENIMISLYTLLCIMYVVIMLVCNYCITSRRINHRGVLPHALVLCLR